VIPDAATLHRAAERVPDETALLDQLGAAGAQFLEESQIYAYERREDLRQMMEKMDFDPAAFGYGVLLGYLAAHE
jgi:hypothetical protein